jgi:hypothetical protein
MKRIALAALFVTSGAVAQTAPQKLTVGVYAPSVELGTAQQRLAYAQSLAKAIEQATGMKTEAQVYATASALEADKVDFAVLDATCVATHGNWRLLANAEIGGATTRPYALYSSVGAEMQALRGKTLAYVQTGCDDAGFIDNAMLESEVDAGFFAARAGKADLTAAVAEVVSYKAAQAVFAPVGAAKGLAKVFDTAPVPTPGFVQIAAKGKLPEDIVDTVAGAVIGFGGGGAIGSWTKPAREPYAALAAHLGKVTKTAVLAVPEPMRLDAKDVLIEPPTLHDTALVDVRHHFVRPPDNRL